VEQLLERLLRICIGNRGRFCAVLTALMMSATLLACGRTEPPSHDEFLIRVRDNVVTVLEFQRAVELAKAAYPHSALQDQEVLRALQKRVLRELVERTVFEERAKDLNITVSPADLSRAVEDVKKDFPDGTFKETLLEQAVSYAAWEEGLKTRLMIEKVVNRDLVSNIVITIDEIEAYYRDHRKELEHAKPAGETPAVDETIIRNLRRQKAEEAYEAYVQELHTTYPVKINTQKWHHIIGSG